MNFKKCSFWSLGTNGIMLVADMANDVYINNNKYN